MTTEYTLKNPLNKASVSTQTVHTPTKTVHTPWCVSRDFHINQKDKWKGKRKWFCLLFQTAFSLNAEPKHNRPVWYLQVLLGEHVLINFWRIQLFMQCSTLLYPYLTSLSLCFWLWESEKNQTTPSKLSLNQSIRYAGPVSILLSHYLLLKAQRSYHAKLLLIRYDWTVAVLGA